MRYWNVFTAPYNGVSAQCTREYINPRIIKETILQAQTGRQSMEAALESPQL